MSNNYLWRISDASIANPESIYYSAEDNVIFVANVVGDELTKDIQANSLYSSPITTTIHDLRQVG